MSKRHPEEYLKDHRYSADISELEAYFTSVVDWAEGVFKDTKPEMRGLEWGRLYEAFHNNPYDPDKVWARVEALYVDADDGKVRNRRGIFEYILGGETHPELLEIRIFPPQKEAKISGKPQELR